MNSFSTTAPKNPLELPDPLSRVEEEQEGYLARGQSQLRAITRDREGKTVLLALAAGFGVGLLLGGALSRPSRPSRWTDRIAAEGLGRRFLDKMDQLLPESLTNRLGG